MRTTKERIKISPLLTFANFDHKILRLNVLDLWLRVLQSRRSVKVRCDRENTAGLPLIALASFPVPVL